MLRENVSKALEVLTLSRLRNYAGQRHCVLARSLRLLAGCAVLLLVGCDRGGLERATVFGNVTLNGAPVESGTIAFYPAEGTLGPSSGGVIEAGRYRVKSAKGVVVGKSRVEISSLQMSGRMVPDPIIAGVMMEEYVEAIPEKYNTESTLVREIESGKNEIDFNLNSES